MLICVYLHINYTSDRTHSNYVKRGSVYAKIKFLKRQMCK